MAKRKKSRLKIAVWAVVAVVVVAAVAAVVLRPRRVKYDTVRTKTGNISVYYSFSGSVEAKNTQIVYASQSMQISDVKYGEEKTVKKDTVVLESTGGADIKAPIAGTISEMDAQKDELVPAGTKLFDIVDYKHLQLTVQVDEYDLATVKKGKEAAVTIHALGRDLKGKVTDIAREGVYASGVTYFDTTISLPQNSSLRVGMSAEAKVLGGSVKNVVELPMEALQFNADGSAYVQVPGKKRGLVKIPVTVGINDGVNVQIKSGLTAGKTVVVPSVSSSAAASSQSGVRLRTSIRTSSAAVSGQ